MNLISEGSVTQNPGFRSKYRGEKPCSVCLKNPFFWLIPGYPKILFRASDLSLNLILTLLKMMPLKGLSKETVTSICCFPHMTSRSTILAMSLGRSLCQNSRLFPFCACVLHEKTWNSKKKMLKKKFMCCNFPKQKQKYWDDGYSYI